MWEMFGIPQTSIKSVPDKQSASTVTFEQKLARPSESNFSGSI
jgi:hypothetical protein